MTLFDNTFLNLTGRAPHPWQAALGAEQACEDRLVRIPTGFGKTLGVLAAWLHHRVVRKDEVWPRRLVWMLPMRVLVEQTEAEVKAALRALDVLWDGVGAHDDRVGVHVLMGGAEAGEWHLWPEECSVLIGTQDMLLSRALNRGYGSARARWPTDFGLLSHDALWVLDEVQLMGVGLATAAQLASFRLRDASRGFRPAVTWAMSATLQKSWVEKSPDTTAWVEGLRDTSLTDKDRVTPLWASSQKPVSRQSPLTPKALANQVAQAHSELPGGAPLTLVVMNTVDRAREVYLELSKLVPGTTDVHLLHSRFRALERARWRSELLHRDAPSRSRVIVATQVIEAGVDLSADLLFTELCPWPSLVQRFGRLARRGGSGQAVVLGLDTDKAAAPYESDDLIAAWDALGLVQGVSSRELETFEQEYAQLLPGLYPYEPEHLLLREELDELFDTTPDLSGADLDVSRYIRTGDERDVLVFWVPTGPVERARVQPPDKRLRPIREGLCAVPFLRARDWLCGKKSGDVVPRKLRKGVNAWVWDYLDGRWRLAERRDLWPGQTVLVDVAAGGYDPRLGWDATSKVPFPLPTPDVASAQEQADSAEEQEELSQASWQTVGFHGGAVADEANAIASRLVPRGILELIELAGRWHDLGKVHPAFQGSIVGGSRPDRQDLAKAPDDCWLKGTSMYRIAETGQRRAGFRHELASTLALFATLLRHCPPAHPSRLGALASVMDGAPAETSTPPNDLEAEIISLSSESFDLVAYLVCSHHGKLRLRLCGSPADQAAHHPQGALPVRGIYDGDLLPPTRLRSSLGVMEELSALVLNLEPSSLGLSPLSGRSWTERANGVMNRYGPFALAWLEAILRAADVRASRNLALRDPALHPVPGGV